jgi:hypothetical protein
VQAGTLIGKIEKQRIKATNKPIKIL